MGMTVSRVALTVLVAVSGLGWSGASAAPDEQRCRGEIATIVGTPRKDDLRGTNGRDVIVGLAGNDRIDARGGDDLVCGGDGRDRIGGGSGDDRLFGELNGFTIDRGGGTWYGDSLDGGPGDDRLVPGFDARGDRFEGYETISYRHAASAVVVDLSGPGAWSTATGDGTDRIRVVPQMMIEGSAHDDILTGSDARDYLKGGLGNDRLSGLAGSDVLEGGPYNLDPTVDDDVVDGGEGMDELVSGGGRDELHGGPGNDRLSTYSLHPVRMYGDEGNDDLLGSATAESGYVADGGTGRDTGHLTSPVADSWSMECCPQGGNATFDEATGVWQASFFAGRVTDVGVTSTGSAVGLEDVALGDEFAWTYSGTEGPDVVIGSYYFPLHATMFGGDDVVTGSSEADVIDGGDGYDEGYRITAKDTVTGLEKTSRIENLRPARATTRPSP